MNKIFSGMRPSGKLHLGNYLGAAKNWIALQDEPDTKQAVYAVVDLHGITTPYDPKTYHAGVMDVILDYMAAGVDPAKSLLIRQSKVHQHAELCWLFNTITPVSWLDRLPTYKEKIEQTGDKYTHMGMLDYPVLMAADVLLYKANIVPVGDDQKAHIDLMNEIAKKFNHMFGVTFEPVKMYRKEGARIMSLKDPSKKMSKTPHQSELGTGQAGFSYIALSDSPDEIREKIKKAVTDSGSSIDFDAKNRPALNNLLTIYHLLSNQTTEQITNEFQGKQYSDFKPRLAEVIVAFLKPFQSRRASLASDMGAVNDILQKSEEKASIIAQTTLSEVKQKMGL